MTPETVQTLNKDIQAWDSSLIQESKERCIKRCLTYKEEIMMTVWHPRRVNILIEMGVDLESVM
jgi:hypothetical protein